MQKDQSDLELIFKKRARRRLVGAIALVLLMVILLPIVLEDRVETDLQQEIAIVMPENASSDEVIVSEELINIETLNAEMTTETSAIPEPAKHKPKVTPPVTPKATVKKTKAVVEKTAKKFDVTPATNQFYVQIGVFSNITNIKKLQVKLDELGYQSATEKIKTETGEKTRLRTTNFDDINEAAIALENIKDAGLTGMVVSQK